MTLILSKSQHQFKLTLAVGGYRSFFFQKTLSFPLLCSILLWQMVQFINIMRNNCCKFILWALIFYKNFFFIRKLFIFFFFLFLLIDFQSPDVVHNQSRSTRDFCMIFVNDDWTLLYDFVLHSTLRKCIAHSPFSCVERTDSIEIMSKKK